VADALSPACAATSSTIPALASLAPGASVTYTCTVAGVTAGFTNVAIDTGTPPSGPDITGSDTAVVTVTPGAPFTPPAIVQRGTVTHPSISIVKDPKAQTTANGGTANFKITVENTGDVTLTDVTVRDPRSPNCDRKLGVLTAGASRTYSCVRRYVRAAFTNIAEATGKPPTGPDVSASDSALVAAAPFTPPNVTTTPKSGITTDNQSGKGKPRVVAHRAPKTAG
jgi:uncharacterized repeat protein (TIGR01451 family)